MSRDYTIKIRISGLERSVIADAANARGMSVADLVRDAALAVATERAFPAAWFRHTIENLQECVALLSGARAFAPSEWNAEALRALEDAVFGFSEEHAGFNPTEADVAGLTA